MNAHDASHDGVAAPSSATDRNRELIARFRQGDEAAFDELFRLHFQPVHDFLRYRTDDAHLAEDAAQVAFITAYHELPKDDRDIAFPSWIRRVASNALTDLWRRSQSKKRGGDQVEIEYDSLSDYLLAGVVPTPSAPHLSIQNRETVDLFWAAASTLSRDQYHVLLLRVKLGLSSREAAESLGKTPNAVDALLVKAKRNLPEAGYAMLAKGAPRCLPCGELRTLVAGFQPGPLTRPEREEVGRHVRRCEVCLEHRQCVPRTTMFISLLRWKALVYLLDVLHWLAESELLSQVPARSPTPRDQLLPVMPDDVWMPPPGLDPLAGLPLLPPALPGVVMATA